MSEQSNLEDSKKEQLFLSSFVFSVVLRAMGMLSSLLVLFVTSVLVWPGLLHTLLSASWPIFFAQFVPSFYLAALASAFHVCRFENQRWTRARSRGMIGSSAVSGLFVDFSGLVAPLFSKVILLAIWFDVGWQKTLGMFLFSQLTLSIWLLIKGDSLFRWIAGTLLVWPIMFLLARTVSWFGFL